MLYYPVDPIVNPSITNKTNLIGLASSKFIESKRHIIGTYDMRIRAWNIDTWQEDWVENQIAQGEVTYQRVVGILSDGTTIGTDGYRLFALRDDGLSYSLLWSVEVGELYGVVLDGDTIFCNYLKYDDYTVHCAKYSSGGSSLFDIQLGAMGEYNPGNGVFTGDKYYFGDTVLNCISSSGAIVFTNKPFIVQGDMSGTVLDKDSNGIYAKSDYIDAGSNSRLRLYKLDFNCNVVWRYDWPVPTDQLGMCIYPDKIVTKASYDDTIRVLNVDNGSVLDTFTIPYTSQHTASITGVNDAIYLAVPGRILGYSLFDFTEMFNLEDEYIDENSHFLPLSSSEVVYSYNGLTFVGIIYLKTATPLALPLVSEPPIILGPNPIRCAKPMVLLQSPTPVGAPWLLHFKIESFADAAATVPIAVAESVTHPELFEYSLDNGLTWAAFPATGLPQKSYGALIRARCEVGPRREVWLKTSVGAEPA